MMSCLIGSFSIRQLQLFLILTLQFPRVPLKKQQKIMKLKLRQNPRVNRTIVRDAGVRHRTKVRGHPSARSALLMASVRFCMCSFSYIS